MNMEESRLIVRLQRLITETLVEKRLGQRRPELTDELYETWLEVEQRGLKETPEYRNVLSRADAHALWLQRAGWPFAAEMIGMAAGEIEKEAVVQQLVAHPAIERSI
jgi:hypothetical protein